MAMTGPMKPLSGERGRRRGPPALLAVFTVILVLMLVQCSDFTLYYELDGGRGLELAIEPGSPDVEIGETLAFSASGGAKPYRFAASFGEIDEKSGLYTAPEAAGVDVVTVEDSAGETAEAKVSILTDFSIIPTQIPLSVTSTYTFSAKGGTKPYSFSMVSGDGSIGVATGQYTAPGTDGVDIVRVTDAKGNISDAIVTVLPAQALTINPPIITLNVGVTYTFAASGGVSPHIFSIFSGVGDGSIDPDTGTLYARTEPDTTMIVRVTDTVDATSDATAYIVSGGLLGLSPASADVEENTTYQFSAYGGSPLYSYAMVPPASGSINNSTGVYTALGAPGDTETVEVTDSLSDTATSSVTVVPATPTNLVANGAYPGPNEIMLTWTDNSDGEDGYIVERKTGDGAFVEIADEPADTESFEDNGLIPNTPYTYRVKAYAGAAESSYSNLSFALSN